MSSFDFSDRVILVTGGSRGLGKAFSEYLASLGANIVINASGSNTDALESTAEDIRRLGGQARTFACDVRESEKIIAFCQSEFGRLDAIIHNAGITRDKSFAKMNFADWQQVYEVNLEASFKLCHAAWPLFKEQQFGRIVFITSAAGIYGNFGQANYSAAKMGMIGLSNTLAVEGARSNIYSNCIAPIGATSLNDNVLSEEQKALYTPEKIAPLVAYLCHENCRENGSLFEAAGGWFAKLRWQRSDGTHLPQSNPSIDAISNHWNEITDFENSHSPESIQAAISHIESRLKE